ncbi:MAG: hypothetical protein GWN99_17435 [Gemmatimonadetes bacterium]|uniref:Uncharacterized protein n=1 Tax=Candidatus Kutchimonas denitrificans TaxID=3056748 RepID=A0AAE4Z9H3_9BACT|nr:hypothetical protein [Gemmatimonadota bacterium]NIR74631.1 hypothetical protein [Candidatus Kutchimonas denitrificans]NIS02821.1 hypothetical protein [Gemmatimonadota bacterium]NIT68982.1 hypothetical protein [Gemmatimonadota bacterium]NIU52287.1 hypothetical protein [Gemmatimonadota bacterium]
MRTKAVILITLLAALVAGGVAVARLLNQVALAFYVLGVAGFGILGVASLLDRGPFGRR